MIEINLLSQGRRFKMPTVLGVDLATVNLKLLLAFILLSWLGESYIHDLAENEIKESRQEIEALSKELAEVRATMQGTDDLRTELEAYNRQVERLKERSEQVRVIINEKTNPKPLLETVSRTLPEDMWIERLEISRDKKITLVGGSDSYSSLGNFIISANETTYFNNLTLTSTNTEEIQEGTSVRRIERFEIRGDIQSFEERTQ